MHILSSNYFSWAFNCTSEEVRLRRSDAISKAFAQLYDEQRGVATSLLEKLVSEAQLAHREQGPPQVSFANADIHIIRNMVLACESRCYYLPHAIYTLKIRYHMGRLSTTRLRLLADQCTGAEDEEEAMEYIKSYSGGFQCGECDQLTMNEDGYDVGHRNGEICVYCRDDRYTWSDYEDGYISNDDLACAIDRYGNEIFIHQDNVEFHWCDEREMYVHDDYEESVIRDYHSSKDRITFNHDEWTEKYGRHMGVELEVECVDGSRASAAKNIHDYLESIDEHMFFERDGSLSNGFEMITDPMSLPALRELFKFLNERRLTRPLKSHNTNTCGLHVHVSKNKMTQLQIQKIVAFVNSPENEWLIRAVARRYSCGFSIVKDTKKIGKSIHLSSDRYEAVNLTSRRTIEFRIFKGSLKYEAVIAAIEFCHAIVEFCKPAVTGVNQLSAGAFMSFCATKMAGETKFLRSYVSQRMAGREVIQENEAA